MQGNGKIKISPAFIVVLVVCLVFASAQGCIRSSAPSTPYAQNINVTNVNLNNISTQPGNQTLTGQPKVVYNNVTNNIDHSEVTFNLGGTGQ
jgi:hypothetical protein